MALTDSEVRTLLFTEAKTAQAIFDYADNTSRAMLMVAQTIDSENGYAIALARWEKYREDNFYPALDYLTHLRNGWAAFTGDVSL